MIRHPYRFLLLAVLMMGCVGDGDFTIADATVRDAAIEDSVVDIDGLTEPRDMRAVDAPVLGTACNPAPTCTAGCPRPWLLAAVQDLGRQECGGRVFRYALHDGELCRCSGYAVPESPNPTALAYLPGAGGTEGTIVVGTDDSVLGLGTESFLIRLDDPENQAVDAFVIENESGELRVGIARQRGGVRSLVFYGPGGVAQPYAGTDGLGFNSHTLTQSPANRRRFRRYGRDAATRDFDPWTGISYDESPFNGPVGVNGSIYSYYHDGLFRTIISTSIIENGALYAIARSDESATSPPAVQCGAALSECQFPSAVLDPTDANIAYAVCRVSSDLDDRLLRVELDGGGCTSVFPQSDGDYRIPRLAVGLDSYWP